MSRRGENIYKRKDGRWEGRFIKKRDSNGKAIYGYIYSKTYTEVKEKLTKVKNETNDNNLKTLNWKFLELSEQWLEKIRGTCKNSTYAKYRNIVFKHIVPEFGICLLSKITTDAVRKFCCDKELIYGLSPKTIKDILSVMKQVIKYAKQFGAMVNCDFACIPIKSNRAAIKVLTFKQTKEMVDYLISNINYVNLGILISFYTGIRIGELCALKFDDIYIESNTINISKTMQRIQNFNETTSKTDIVISSPKSESSIREIPIPQFITDIIINNNLYKENAFILTGNSTRFIEPRTLENKFNRIAKTCNIQNTSFHTIRHTFATNCVEAGVDVKSLSEILGHSTVSITLNRYVHSSMQTKKKNMEKLYMNFF